MMKPELDKEFDRIAMIQTFPSAKVLFERIDELKGKLAVTVDALKQISGTHEQFCCDDQVDCEFTAAEALKKIGVKS